MPDMGRAEANWLVNHMANVNDEQTLVSIDEQEIRAAVLSAKECERDSCRCTNFDSGDKWNMGAKAHREVTKAIARRLRRIIKDSGQDIVDLSISW